MTIVASVKVRDGLVLGTDSMTQISAPTPEGEIQILKAYSNARKLFQIKDAPIGVMLHYRTTTSSHAGTTDGSGSGSVTFGIGRPTIGYTVRVNITAGQASCATAFTPQ